MVVRKNSEKKFVDYFLELKEKDPNWKGVIADAFYPQSSYVRFKGKVLHMASKPMVPGLIYLKTIMGPDIADDLEGIKNVYGFTKNAAGLVLPLSHEEGKNLEQMRERTGQDLDPDVLKMKKDEYVTVIDGRHKGRYGILIGAKGGRLEVCLRSDYKDEWDVFDARELRYLAEPPEKKWNVSGNRATMSFKDSLHCMS
jgi:transcription antitermination factor NusG